ncbi:MAG: hypothetical protein IJW66_01715 [Clostridia bacterium]|nr:hypothetical protein [Clostridia bacterium]
MKKRKKLFKILLSVAFALSIFSSVSLFASASEVEAPGEGVTTESDENIFTEIYLAVTENSADILSLLSFAASVTVALFYKYALSPLIKGGLEKISSGVKDISGESSKEYRALAEAQAKIAEREERMEESLASLSRSLCEMQDNEKASLEKNLLTVMHAQVNMLYEIFQSSALPVYQKEAVGNMINEMRSELAKNESTVE